MNQTISVLSPAPSRLDWIFSYVYCHFKNVQFFKLPKRKISLSLIMFSKSLFLSLHFSPDLTCLSFPHDFYPPHTWSLHEENLPLLAVWECWYNTASSHALPIGQIFVFLVYGVGLLQFVRPLGRCITLGVDHSYQHRREGWDMAELLRKQLTGWSWPPNDFHV